MQIHGRDVVCGARPSVQPQGARPQEGFKDHDEHQVGVPTSTPRVLVHEKELYDEFEGGGPLAVPKNRLRRHGAGLRRPESLVLVACARG